MKKLALQFYFIISVLLIRQLAFADTNNSYFLQQYDNRNGLSNSAIPQSEIDASAGTLTQNPGY